jgi:hypothetical protein
MEPGTASAPAKGPAGNRESGQFHAHSVNVWQPNIPSLSEPQKKLVNGLIEQMKQVIAKSSAPAGR